MTEYYLRLREDLADRISEVLEEFYADIRGEPAELLEALLPEIVDVVESLNNTSDQENSEE